jgi:hypothetical protein
MYTAYLLRSSWIINYSFEPFINYNWYFNFPAMTPKPPNGGLRRSILNNIKRFTIVEIDQY